MFSYKPTIKNIASQSGLTLVETTLALGILTIGTLASLTLMLSSFNYVQQTEHEIVVVNLAREGIEIIRGGIRSYSNAVCRAGVNAGDSCVFDGECPLSQCVSALFTGNYDDNDYFVDNTTASLDSVAANLVVADSASQCTACQLYINNGQYTHSAAGTPTIFNRMVTIKPDPMGNLNEKIIISEVSWTVKNNTYSYTLEAHLTNWQ